MGRLVSDQKTGYVIYSLFIWYLILFFWGGHHFVFKPLLSVTSVLGNVQINLVGHLHIGTPSGMAQLGFVWPNIFQN